jgi:exonuclease SbcD
VLLNCGKPLKRWIARNGIEEALAWCEEGRDANAWIDLEIYTGRVLTVEEQKRLRELNPGIVNIRPQIMADCAAELDYENREGKKIDDLFREFYKFRMGLEISDELMGVFLDVLNSSEESGDGGEAIETAIP